ncbi:MAG: hypothetical protein AB1816_02440 [Bacillota bacterium]
MLEAVGVRGVVSVTACWVGRDAWGRKYQYVCALCRDTWRFGDRDSGVPVERAFRLVPGDDAWRLAGVAQVLPDELDAVFEMWERVPGRRGCWVRLRRSCWKPPGRGIKSLMRAARNGMASAWRPRVRVEA